MRKAALSDERNYLIHGLKIHLIMDFSVYTQDVNGEKNDYKPIIEVLNERDVWLVSDFASLMSSCGKILGL